MEQSLCCRQHANHDGGTYDKLLPMVLSSFLCKFFIGQFFEERQVLMHFPYRV
jgi:hypothetical protein